MNSGASDSRPSDARSKPSTGGALTMAIASSELVEREIGIEAPPSGQSTVEISLEPDGDGTRLRLTHRDLPADLHSFHGVGWDYALPRLAVVAAGGDPGPDPVRSIIRGTLMAARSLPPRYLYRLGRQRLRTRTAGRPQR